MIVKRPSRLELKKLAGTNRFSLSSEELKVFSRSIESAFKSYAKLDSMASMKEAHSPKRDAGRRPRKEENRFGAWAWMCSIRERNSGPLFGKRIAIKDNISVAGIPMRNGSPMLQGYMPKEDAVIVKRILEAGGEIVGKAQCENLCVSGGSHTSFPEPVKNPRNPEYMAGGSSSGSAALLASGEVDLALGADQAGSIRIPASWCGVYGLKPTWGLVPYTGVVPMEPSLDHVGPMANSVEDLALLLGVMAGRDEFDMRQRDTPFTLPNYASTLKRGVEGLRIGILMEGFGIRGLSDSEVDRCVMSQGSLFAELGATVKEISIPEHSEGFHVWRGIVNEGTWNTLIRENGLEHSGFEDTHFIESWAEAKKRNSNLLPPTMKLITLTGNFMAERFRGRYFAMSMTLRNELRRAYDSAFRDFDIFVMPSTPQRAKPLTKMNLQESLEASICNLHNTCPFDVSGHPALSVPCFRSGELPVGMMFVGRKFEEATLLRAAYSYEKVSGIAN